MKYAMQTVSMIYQNGKFLTAIVTREYVGAITFSRTFACDKETASKINQTLLLKRDSKFNITENGDLVCGTVTWYRFMGWME